MVRKIKTFSDIRYWIEEKKMTANDHFKDNKSIAEEIFYNAHPLIYNLEVLKYLFEHGMTPYTIVAGKPFFILMIEYNDFKMVKFCIENGADVNYTGYIYTPLNMACYHERTDMIKMLIKYGADVNLANENTYSPLVESIHHGNSRGVKILVENGAVLGEKPNLLNTKNHRVYTRKSLETHDMHKKFGMYKYLIRMGFDLFNYDNQFDMIYTYLINNPVFIEKEVYEKKVKDIKFLLTYGARILNSSVIKAIRYASIFNDLKLLRLFKEYGFDYSIVYNEFDSRQICFLEHAFVNSKIEVIRFLLEAGVDVKNFDQYMGVLSNRLFVSNKKHKSLLKIVKELVKYGADINIDKHGNTPLINFVELQVYEVVIFLINQGANVDAIDEFNNSALFYASRSKNGKMFQYIYERAKNKNDFNKNIFKYFRRNPEFAVNLCREQNIDLSTLYKYKYKKGKRIINESINNNTPKMKDHIKNYRTLIEKTNSDDITEIILDYKAEMDNFSFLEKMFK